MNILSRHSVFGRALAGLAVVLVATACTETEVIQEIIEVEIDRPFFNDPPAAAQGFLGYGTPEDQEDGLTTCGNCHIGPQSAWATTVHAHAWEGLQGSGHAQEFCEGCHTVGPLGNASADGGWTTTGDPRYHDVQCESCHGAGQPHVLNPDASQPLASADVGEGKTGNCGDCHEGSHHPFVEEWSESPHARVVGFAADRDGCNSCHSGQAAMARFDPGATTYTEADGTQLAVTCSVCHDPHGSPNEGQLRAPVRTISAEQHMCGQCHNRRPIPDGASSHGLHPHSPETALVEGEAGFFFGGIEVGQIRATHATQANPELCATCHVFSYEIDDQATGDFLFTATGHNFRPMPCVDEQGIPEGFEVQCGLETTARSYVGCTSAGTGLSCHGSAEALVGILQTGILRVETLVEELHELLEQVDPNLDEPGGEIDATDGVITVAEGAFFNMELAEFGSEEFGTNTVLGSLVHNPFLIEAHLISSIAAVEDEYNVSASIQEDWGATLQLLMEK
jgi:predicted CXXCH cytochrome family protein